MKMKVSPDEEKQFHKIPGHSGIRRRGFGNPNMKALQEGIDARFSQISSFLLALQIQVDETQAEIEVRLDQIEDLIKALHEKELGA